MASSSDKPDSAYLVVTGANEMNLSSEKQVVNLEKRLEEVQIDVASLKMQIQQEAEEKDAHSEVWETERRAQEDETRALEKALEHKEQQNATLREKIGETGKEAAANKKKLVASETRVAKLEQDCEKLNNETKTLRDVGRISEEQFKKQRKNLEQARVEIAMLKQQLTERQKATDEKLDNIGKDVKDLKELLLSSFMNQQKTNTNTDPNENAPRKPSKRSNKGGNRGPWKI